MSQAHFGAALQGGANAAERGALGNRALFVLRELLCLLPSWEGLQAEAGAFLGASLQAAEAVAGTLPAGLPASFHQRMLDSAGACSLNVAVSTRGIF